jgi:large subunit ribosomal protein L3
MPSAIIGKKLGMTQRFADDGSVIPLTVVQAGPCVVVQRKTQERDGYEAIQLGLVEPGRRVQVTKPQEGHFKKAGLAPCKVLREFRLDRIDKGEPEKAVEVGDSIKVSVFSPNDKVHVHGVSKGKGFAGVMKRHGFSGGRATHGSMFHRAPGSIGMAAYPARVLKGTRGPGQLGNKQVTVKNLQVVEVNEEENLLLLKGAVPGANGTYLEIVRASKAEKADSEQAAS